MKKKIILASTSPRRHSLAQQMGLEFEIFASKYEEDMSMDLGPEELAMTLAYGKAKEVADRVDNGIVLGIDTFVVFNGKKLGKPKSEADAFQMLKDFSEKYLEVYSGVVLIDCKSKEEIKDYEVTKVKFRKMDDSEIMNYIKTGEPMDKAGAFGIQSLGSIFIEKIDGCYTNVIGFPIYNIFKNLKRLGVDIFEYDGWKKVK
ncbi:MAG: Maf family protein [Candidatus Paceibacterota bacterium]|jgi:septum formation protein